MHSFATIEGFARFKTVAFYTLKGDEATFSETDNFLIRMEKELEYKEQFERLLSWLEIIGNDSRGADADLFRQERICVALPPPKKHLASRIDLRLYCHRVNEHVVILFNGGIKTANNAQDCPNVSRHFYNAQSWVKQLQEIGIETLGRNIINIEDLYIKI